MAKLRWPLRQELREPLSHASLERVGERIAQRRQRGWLAPRSLATGALAAGALAIAAMFLMQDRTPLKTAPTKAPMVAALVQRDGSALAPVELLASAPQSTLELSDGTRVTLSGRSRLVPRKSTPERCELSLEHGSAHFEVSPQGKRRFVVYAGSLEVEVVGTAFRVQRGSSTESVTRVEVEHGRVRVTSPDGARLLGKGERFEWNEREPEAAAQPASAEAAHEPQPEPEQPTHARGTRNPRTPPENGAPGLEPPVHDTPSPDAKKLYRDALARGDHKAAYEALGSFGSAVRQARSAAELLELADVARGAGRAREACLAFEQVLARYDSDPRAGLAALTLGKLRLDVLREPKPAARALERALELSLPPTLQEDALARYVRALELSGDLQGARKAAEQYKRRFPNGPHRVQVEGF